MITVKTYVCAQSDYRYRSLDWTDYHQNTMERTACLRPHRMWKSDASQRYNQCSTSTVVDRSLSSKIFKNNASLETKQLRFRFSKFNTYHYGFFDLIANKQVVLNANHDQKNSLGTDTRKYLDQLVCHYCYDSLAESYFGCCFSFL